MGHPGGRGAKRIRALRRDKGDDGATVLEEVFDQVIPNFSIEGEEWFRERDAAADQAARDKAAEPVPT